MPENIGTLLFAFTIWMFNILPLITGHSFFCFLCMSLICVIYLASCHYHKQSGWYVHKKALVWVFAVIPLLFSNLNEFSIYTCATILSYITGFIFIIFNCHKTSQYDIGISALKLLAGIYIASIYLQYFYADIFRNLFADRFNTDGAFFYEASISSHYFIGMGGSPGVAVVNCTIALAILFSFKGTSKWRRRFIKLPYVIVIFFAYLLIGKKSGILSAVFASAVIYLMTSSKKMWKKLMFLSMISILLGIIVYFLTQIFSTAYLSMKLQEGITQLLEGRDFSSGRIELYRDAWNEFRTHPLFGIGWLEFSSRHGNLAHNIYLQLLCETGIVGFLLFAIPFFYNYFMSCRLILRIIKENVDQKIINYMTFSLFIQSEFLFISLFENNLYMTMPLYLYFFACGVSFTVAREFNGIYRRRQEVLPGI